MATKEHRRSALVVVDVLAAVVIGLCVLACIGLAGWGLFAFATYAPEGTLAIVAILLVVGALIWIFCRHTDDADWKIGKGWLK